MDMIIYSRHRCEAKHKTWRTLAACIWPYAAWTAGEGPYCVLCPCRALTVTMHATSSDALAVPVMNGDYCGGQCNPDRHKIVLINRRLWPAGWTPPVPAAA